MSRQRKHKTHRMGSPNWSLPEVQSPCFFPLIGNEAGCRAVGPAGGAVIAAAYLSRRNVAKKNRTAM